MQAVSELSKEGKMEEDWIVALNVNASWPHIHLLPPALPWYENLSPAALSLPHSGMDPILPSLAVQVGLKAPAPCLCGCQQPCFPVPESPGWSLLTEHFVHSFQIRLLLKEAALPSCPADALSSLEGLESSLTLLSCGQISNNEPRQLLPDPCLPPPPTGQTASLTWDNASEKTHA